MSDYHISVLLQETIDALQVKSGKKYIDATLGSGGHTEEIIKKGGVVLGIDQDQDAIAYTKEKFASSNESTVQVVQGNFNNIEEIAKQHGFSTVSGILLDLGVSSHQFDDATRGFSFQGDNPLDMRMDKHLSVTAKDLVNGLTKGELIELFEKYGEEYFAKRIAEKITMQRLESPIETTGELARLIASCYPKGMHKIHPATKVFQALRIAVNDELGSLKQALPQSVALLEKGGRLVIISFHSLEDRIVKELFEKFEEQGQGKVITKKPIVPSEGEIAKNRKSRSSKLRIFEKI